MQDNHSARQSQGKTIVKQENRPKTTVRQDRNMTITRKSQDNDKRQHAETKE